MLVNPSGAELTECIYPRAAVAPLPDPGLRISQPLRGCRVLRLSEHGRATPSDTIYCIYLCISPERVELFITPVCVSTASTDGGRQCNNEAASKGLTSIFDAKIPLFVSCADTRTSVPTSGCSLLYKLVDGHNNEHQKQQPNVGTLVRASAQPTCSHKPHPLQGCTLRVR